MMIIKKSYLMQWQSEESEADWRKGEIEEVVKRGRGGED